MHWDTLQKVTNESIPIGNLPILLIRFEEDTGWYICAGNGAKLAKFSYIWEALFNVSLMWSCQGHTGNILISCFTFSRMRYVCHQVDQQARSAVIEFMSAESAENFTRQHNRRMIDLAILSVSRIAWTPSFADSWKPGRPGLRMVLVIFDYVHCAWHLPKTSILMVGFG